MEYKLKNVNGSTQVFWRSVMIQSLRSSKYSHRSFIMAQSCVCRVPIAKLPYLDHQTLTASRWMCHCLGSVIRPLTNHHCPQRRSRCRKGPAADTVTSMVLIWLRGRPGAPKPSEDEWHIAFSMPSCLVEEENWTWNSHSHRICLSPNLHLGSNDGQFFKGAFCHARRCVTCRNNLSASPFGVPCACSVATFQNCFQEPTSVVSWCCCVGLCGLPVCSLSEHWDCCFSEIIPDGYR
jgi:hypothetical protein